MCDNWGQWTLHLPNSIEQMKIYKGFEVIGKKYTSNHRREPLKRTELSDVDQHSQNPH